MANMEEVYAGIDAALAHINQGLGALSVAAENFDQAAALISAAGDGSPNLSDIARNIGSAGTSDRTHIRLIVESATARLEDYRNGGTGATIYSEDD